MTGITAEKHDSFISVDGANDNGFSGKALIKGERTRQFSVGGFAQPSRRGYTAWDPTSYAFIRTGSCASPRSARTAARRQENSAFEIHGGVKPRAIRILRLFGNGEAKRVDSQVGAEQIL